MTSSDTAPSCQTWLQGEESASKSGLLLRALFVVEPLQTFSSRAHGSHPHLQRSVLVFWALATLKFPGETGSSLCLNVLAENTGFGPASGLGFLWSFPRAHKQYRLHMSSPIRSSSCNSSNHPTRDMLPSRCPTVTIITVKSHTPFRRLTQPGTKDALFSSYSNLFGGLMNSFASV